MQGCSLDLLRIPTAPAAAVDDVTGEVTMTAGIDHDNRACRTTKRLGPFKSSDPRRKVLGERIRKQLETEILFPLVIQRLFPNPLAVSRSRQIDEWEFRADDARVDVNID